MNGVVFCIGDWGCASTALHVNVLPIGCLCRQPESYPRSANVANQVLTFSLYLPLLGFFFPNRGHHAVSLRRAAEVLPDSCDFDAQTHQAVGGIWGIARSMPHTA